MMESTYSVSSLHGLVSSKRRLLAAELGREAEVEADGFGVADVQVAVRLGRKARVHAAAVLVGLQVLEDDVPDEVRGGDRTCGRFGARRIQSFLQQSWTLCRAAREVAGRRVTSILV